MPPKKTEPKMPGGSTAHPTLRRGSTGESMRFLQTRLKQLGYDPGPIDGIFGSGTERAVKNFQADKGLMVDGIVGKQTWGALT
jgi:peptidoglycan hydrolase-like protein with peptidoglycan-binding domain